MFRRFTALGLVAALMLAVSPVQALAQTSDSSKGTVNGTATDGLRKPIVDAQVRLLQGAAGTKKVAETRTDAAGLFTFLNVTPDIYTIQLLRDGHVVGVAGNLRVEANKMTPAAVTGVQTAKEAEPKGGFNKKRFIIYSVAITVLATLLVRRGRK